MNTTFVMPSIPLKYSEMIPEVIYHYTSPDGIIGIITNKELWFSRYDCLNDKGEGKYILEVYNRTINSLSDKYDSTFLERIKNIEPNYHEFFRWKDGEISESNESKSYYTVDKNTTPYLCCFSRKNDSLPMWNYYSKNGHYEGYNIGIDWTAVQNGQDNINICCCIYDENDQIELLKEFIEEAYINFTENNHTIRDIRYRLSIVLSTYSLQFKHRAFEHEDEVRLIYHRPDDDEDIHEVKGKLFYRQTQGIIIPYYKKSLDLTETIKSITIGPLIKKEVAEKTIEAMLKEQGIIVPISQSMIPVRY